MNKLNLASLIMFIMIFINHSYASTCDFNKKTSFQLIEKEIVVTRVNSKRVLRKNPESGNFITFKGTKLNFKSKQSSSNENNYYWNFGQEHNKEGVNTDHQFNDIGTYNVTLKVVSKFGNSSFSKLTLEVISDSEIKRNNLADALISINVAGDKESKFSMEQLVENVLIKGGCSTVDNFSVKVNGKPEDSKTKNYGYFNKGASTGFPFEDGIVITTGIAFEAGNVINNVMDHPDFDNTLPGDTDIEAALDLNNSFNASFVKFNFTPLVDNISFRYIMASEEYDPNYECKYSDGFAFLLREVGTVNYTNLAVLPNGAPISVTGVNNSAICGMNQGYFEGYQLGDTNYYGRTGVLTASSAVTPGVTYEIKIVIADDQDSSLDAAIFLEGGGFDMVNVLGEDITIANGRAGCDNTPIVLQTKSLGAIHTWYLNGVVIPGKGETITVTETGIYSVNIDSGGTDCVINDSVIIEFLHSDDATFEMIPNCDGATATITGALEGLFSFNPVPNDGAVIDATTGVISNGAPETTYSVEYITQDVCSNSSIVSIQTLPSGNALFTIRPTCDGGESILSGTPGGVFSFDPIPIDGSIINPTTGVVTNGTGGATYTIVYTVNNCFATHTESFTILPELPLEAPGTLTSCDETTPGAFAFFDLESKNNEILETTSYTSATYHDTQIEAKNGTNPIISPYLSASRIIYVRAQNLVCHSTTTLELKVVSIPTIVTHTYTLCDDSIALDNDPKNDSTTFNLASQSPILLNGQDPVMHTVSYHLSEADAELGINPLVSSYTNTINPQPVYTRIENRDTLCSNTGEMILEVNPLPKIEVEDTYVLCIDNEGDFISPILDTGLNITAYSFEWYLNGILIPEETNSNITVSQAGKYSVTATNNATGCFAISDTVVVESSPPLVEAEQVSVIFVEDNNILATATSTGLSTALFEFKIDNGPWVSNGQNNNTYTFENVSAGSHIITARDIEGCGESSTLLIVLDFVPYFTPNNDGFHDTWNIVGLENQPNAKLYIFDRYGKLLKQISPSGNGWDGTSNNNLMPINDYWFTLEYRNPNTNSPDVFKSHFTLKR